jgi:hypothetical protein
MRFEVASSGGCVICIWIMHIPPQVGEELKDVFGDKCEGCYVHVSFKEGRRWSKRQEIWSA